MADYTVNVTFANNEFSFSGDCDAEGDVDVTFPSGVTSRTIEFKLSAGSGDVWAGVKIADSEQDLASATAQTSTTPNFYGSTCFKVGPTDQESVPPTLILTDVDNTAAPGVWFYCLGVEHSDGTQSWPDPKIQNPGGDSHIRNPGLYHGGQKTAVLVKKPG